MDQIFESKINALNCQLEKHKTRFNVARDDLESLQESLELSSIYMEVKLETNKEKIESKLENIDQRYKGARNHASKLEKMICPKENEVSEYEKLFLEIKSKLQDIVKDEMNNKKIVEYKKNRQERVW